MATFITVLGSLNCQVWFNHWTLDRQPSSNICFDDTYVSHRHFEVFREAQKELVSALAGLLDVASAVKPGGGYLTGHRPQEEDLCRLLPHSYNSLVSARSEGAYPIKENCGNHCGNTVVTLW